jgi:hypothetical protein
MVGLEELEQKNGKVVVLIEEQVMGDGAKKVVTKSIAVESEEDYEYIKRLASLIIWFCRDGYPSPVQLRELRRIIDSEGNKVVEATVIDLATRNFYSTTKTNGEKAQSALELENRKVRVGGMV